MCSVLTCYNEDKFDLNTLGLITAESVQFKKEIVYIVWYCLLQYLSISIYMDVII